MLKMGLCLLLSNCGTPAKNVEVENIRIREIDIMSNLPNNQVVNLSEIATSIKYC